MPENRKLILASASRFRRTLMENAGLSFEAIPASIDERAIEAPLEERGMPPEQVALELAKAKALDVSARYAGCLVLGSDQTMSLGSRVYHKPSSVAEAKEHLISFSGKTHQLNSAVVLARSGRVVWEHISSARLTVRTLTSGFIERYLERVGESVLQSVGGYQLEGEGVQLFESIDGDYFTIIGLPMLPLLNELRRMEVIDA